LRDRPKPGRPERLSEAEQAALAARVFAGPDPKRDGVSAWILAEFAAGLPEEVHAVLVLDRAGWRGAQALAVPANVTLVPLPPYSPELNPVERGWLCLRERFLSLQVFPDYRAIVDTCCAAWNQLVAEPGRIRSLCDQPWIRNVGS
jgi:DDE superfamily endonuclease